MSEAEKDERASIVATAQQAEEPDDEVVDEPVAAGVITEEVSPRQAMPSRGATQEGDEEEEDDGVPLLGDPEPEALRSRWMDIQTGFVDDPHNSVAKADELVEQTIRGLTESLANRRSALRGEWDRKSELSTEDLRIAMKRYRTLFNQIAAIES